MNVSEKGREFIKSWENLRLEPYICPSGYLTVGWGHVTSSSSPITQEQAEEYFENDIRKVENTIHRLVYVSLLQNMFDALASFIFNVGSFAFRSSSLRGKLNRGEYLDAADEFLRWIYGGGRILKGLVRRRQAEREMFLGGDLYVSSLL